VAHRLFVPFVLGLLLLTPACFLTALSPHTYQKRVEPSKEQKLELYTTTATFLYEDGELDRAQDQAVKALEIEPKNRAMRRMVGWIRLRKSGNDDLILAERFFRDLRKEGDENENTSLGLAITCERMGKAYDEVGRAIATGQRQPEAGKDPTRAAQELAEKSRKYWQESIQLCNDILKVGEGNTNAMNTLQRVHALAGNYEESLEWSRRLLERTNEELVTWRRMLQEKDLTDSEENLFRKNERAATSLENDTHLFAATLLFKLQRYEEALAHLDALVESSPELAQAYSLRGQMRARVGQYELAIADLDRYLALSDAPYENPDVQKAFELRADAEKHVKKPDAKPDGAR
jgi:tetratricopeptide (TPR) repeat protein